MQGSTEVRPLIVSHHSSLNSGSLVVDMMLNKFAGKQIIGASLSEPHTNESLQNVHSTVSRNLVNHSIFGRTYVQQCHRICYTSQDFVCSIVSRNSRLTVSRNLINHSIFGHTYAQQCHGIRDTSQSIVNYSVLVCSTASWILDITQSSINHPLSTTAEGTCKCV